MSDAFGLRILPFAAFLADSLHCTTTLQCVRRESANCGECSSVTDHHCRLSAGMVTIWNAPYTTRPRKWESLPSRLRAVPKPSSNSQPPATTRSPLQR